MKAYGTIFADELNYLFSNGICDLTTGLGCTVCYGGPPSFICSSTPVYFNIGQIGNIVFSVASVADWNLYTGGFTLSSTPNQIYSLHSSQFAGNLCGGTASAFPSNYQLYCDPVFDQQFALGVTYVDLQRAAIVGATRGEAIPIYAGVNHYVASNSCIRLQCRSISPGGIIVGSCRTTDASLVSVLGHGVGAGSGFWSMLNMHPAPGYTPANPLYAAGATCVDASGASTRRTCIQRGISSPTLHLTPWTFTTPWEAEPLSQIYDTLLAIDPNSGGLCQTQTQLGTAHCMDWMTGSHRISSAILPDGTSQTTMLFYLRHDMLWHDGSPVTSHDACFSILSYRDAPSASFFPSVSNVVSCTALDSARIQVVLNGINVFSELDIGRVFIVPEHVWAPVCGGLAVGTDSCNTPSALANTSTDYVAQGYLVGSGPFICNASQGVSTIPGQMSCTRSAPGITGGQALTTDGRIFLKRNHSYMRCCPNLQTSVNTIGPIQTTNLQAFEWADFFNGKDGLPDINDLAQAAQYFGLGCSPGQLIACYLANPIYSVGFQFLCQPGQTAPCDDIGSIDTMASYFDFGLTCPYEGTPTGLFTGTPPNGHPCSVFGVPPPPVGGLTYYDPNVDPFVVTTGSTVLGYYQACQRITGGVNCRIVSGTTFANTATFTGPLPGGATSTASPTGSTGITFTFTGTFPSGLYEFIISGTSFDMTVNLL